MALTDRALDRSRPLWQLWYVEGVEGGRVALILRIHHALIDGMGGVEMFARLFGSLPRAGPVRSVHVSSAPATHPNVCRRSIELLVRSDSRAVRRSVARVPRSPRRARGVASRSARRGRALTAGACSASRLGCCSTGASSSPDKRLGLISLPLDEIKAVKNAFGVTVHDVVLAIVAGSVRDYLLERDELPDEPLSVLCPMNMRTGAEDDPTGGNYFASGLESTPDAAPRPGDQLRAFTTTWR